MAYKTFTSFHSWKVLSTYLYHIVTDKWTTHLESSIQQLNNVVHTIGCIKHISRLPCTHLKFNNKYCWKTSNSYSNSMFIKTSCSHQSSFNNPQMNLFVLNHRPPWTKTIDHHYISLTYTLMGGYPKSLKEISTQNGPFNFYSNSMSSCVSQWNCFKFEIPYRS